MSVRFKIYDSNHAMGFALRDILVGIEGIDFASLIIKHPQSKTIEGVVDSKTLSLQDVKRRCLDACDTLIRELEEIQLN